MAKIKVICPACNTPQKIPSEKAQRIIKCKICGVKFDPATGKRADGTLNICCPYCDEGQAILESEYNTLIKCVRCGGGFNLGELEAKREDEKEARKQEIREKRLLAKQNFNKKIKMRVTSKKAKREKEYSCKKCGEVWTNSDINAGFALEDMNGYIFCRECYPEYKICPACGEKIKRTAKKCRYCREPLTAAARHKVDRYSKAKLKLTEDSAIGIIIAIILAAFIIIGGIIGYSEYQKYKTRKDIEKALRHIK